MGRVMLFYTLAFGREEYYLQSQLLIVSFLKNRTEDASFRLYTDNPGFFDVFKGRIEIIAINKSDLYDCVASHGGYIFSVKINLIEQVSREEKYDFTFYVDTDVVFSKPVSSFISEIKDEAYFMYEREKKYCAESKKEYWNALNNIDILDCFIGLDSHQWNSGVVGLPRNSEDKIKKASVIMDNLHAYGVKQHTLEQVAISLVLESSGVINQAKGHLVHYHANKNAWNQLCVKLNTLKNDTVSVEDMIIFFANIYNFPLEKPKKKNAVVRLFPRLNSSMKKRLNKLVG